MTNFIEKTYKENGIEVIKLKTVGRPLRIGSNSYLDIAEIECSKRCESWLTRHKREMQEKQIDTKPKIMSN